MTLDVEQRNVPSGGPPRLGAAGWVRWGWRNLTSMRTALLLLLLLAVASIPGSVFPQRGTDAAAVRQYLADNPGSGPWLDRLGMFDVFAAPWFAAIYLLLGISLVGCIVPRTGELVRSLRRPPPPAPSRLSRLPVHTQVAADADVLDRAERYLRENHWRVRRGEDYVAAEKGHLHEVGNLLFHMCFIVLLLAVALGGLLGWSAKVIVTEGSGFSGSLTQFDSFRAGRLVDAGDIPPFAVTVTGFDATYQDSGMQRGAPREFVARTRVSLTPEGPEVEQRFGVNSPLRVGGVKVSLTGHGYAPEIRITDPDGSVVFDDAVVFLPRDANLTSDGVVKLPDRQPQLGLTGIFLPTASIDPQRGPVSTFPSPKDPRLFLGAFTGDLGLDSGVPRNVYELDTTDLKRLGNQSLAPGDEWTLPDGTTVAFTGVREYVNLSLSRDPGRGLALLAAALVVVGVSMSLLISRRRVWIRAGTVTEGRTVSDIGGLSKSGGGRVQIDVEELRAAVCSEETV